jgi:two-component system LytT family sensor kinase
MNRIKKRQLAEIVIHVLFWTAVFYALNSLTTSDIRFRVNSNGAVMEGEELHTLLPFSFITLGLLMVLFYGNILWLFRKILSFRNSIARLAMAGGWFLLLFLVDDIIRALFADRNHFNSPPFPPSQPARFPVAPHPGFPAAPQRSLPIPPKLGFSLDVLDRSQVILLLIFLSVMGVSIAYFFLKEWTKADLSRNQMQANQLSTEIKFLKSQINPHFLFNTLNNLFSMAQAKGNDDLADGISKLSGMMRYMIYDSNAESVLLKKEIAYLEDCITLNKLRYDDDEIKITFDHPAQPGNVTIAPMLFIPFVENAFKHGVAIGQTSGIDIAIVIADQKLIFTCANTKYSAIKKMADEKSGIGLENVKRRLDLLYPGKHNLQLDEDNGKYIVKLEIDLQ